MSTFAACIASCQPPTFPQPPRPHPYPNDESDALILKSIIVHNAAPESEAATKQEQLPQWRISPDQTGPLRVLTWGGIARNTPQWPQRWASLYRGSLYLLEHSDAEEPLESWNIWNGRYVAFPGIGFATC